MKPKKKLNKPDIEPVINTQLKVVIQPPKRPNGTAKLVIYLPKT
jgi:hypothetical protein